jgi:hypothetical protein
MQRCRATLTVDLPEASAPQIARLIMDITSGRASVVMDPCTEM